MARLLETDSLSNQNIATRLAIGAYTADATRLVYVRVLARQVAGNGDYIFDATITSGGVEHLLIPITTANAASGITAIGAITVPILMFAGEILTVYIDGLTGDNTTPDLDVSFAVSNCLEPTAADRTLDVAATGEAGLDFDNIRAATGATTLTNITVPTVTAVTGLTAANLDAKISDVKAKTDLIPASPAAVGSAMTLADDAITAAKFDQLTAFPLESADSGSTKVARTGADSDTLETLSDQVDAMQADVTDILADTGTDGVVVAGLTTAAKALVQAEAEDALKAYDLDHLIETTAGSEEPTDGSYLDQIMHKDGSQTFSATTDSLEAIRDTISDSTLTVVDAVDAGDLNITIAATYDGTPDGLTFSSDWEKVYFTLKKGAKAETDAEAICQIVVSATQAATDGLLYLNGSVATELGLALTDGALTVDRAAGTCRILIDSSATALLSPAENLAFDIKEHTTAGKDNVVGEGTADVRRTPTRAIS